MKLRNPFTAPGEWCKANFHTHTTTSDGRASPEETAELYRKAGYKVLALTDHWATNDVSGLSSKGLLVIGGIEYHPVCAGRERGNPHHLVGVNVPHGFGFPKREHTDPNAAIRAVKRAGGESFLAHPLWCGHRYDHYAGLKGLIGVEVYNGTCDRIGRAGGDHDWCYLLDEGRVLGGLAVDDTHGPGDRFRGWVWLKLEELTVPAVMDALRTGCYFSSTGPRITDFRVADGEVTVHCTPAETVYLMAQTYHGARRQAEEGKAIRKFTCKIPPAWQYVRAVVVDHQGRRAWSNPATRLR